jgi:hypothetical protein
VAIIIIIDEYQNVEKISHPFQIHVWMCVMFVALKFEFKIKLDCHLFFSCEYYGKFNFHGTTY